MAERKFLYMDAEGFSTPQDVGDTITLGGLTITPGNINLSGSGKVVGLADGTASGDAVNKGQLDSAVITGGTVKEMLLTEDQLNDTDGIYAAMALYFAAQPAAGDTVALTDGTNTRTYTFVSNQGAESAATDVSIESDAATAMQRLVTRMNADAGNTWWSSAFTTELDEFNSGGAVVVWEEATAAGDSTSRIYGTWATQASFQVIEYGGDTDYRGGTVSTASTSDPASGEFGFRSIQSDLIDGEIHFVRVEDTMYSWDDSDNTWQVLTGPSSIPDATAASGGGVKGKITVDSDFGLAVSSGVLSINLSATPGLEFSTGALQAKVDTTAGLELTASGIGIDIGVTNPGIGFDGSGDLEAKASDGITKDANGIKADIDTAAGLQFDATASPDKKVQVNVESDGGIQFDGVNGGIEIKIVSTDRLSVGASGLDVVGLPSLFEINGVAVGATVTAANLDTLTDGSNADALHTHTGTPAAERIANSITCGEDLALGDPVYFSAADTVSKADADKATPAKAKMIGVASAAATNGNPATIISYGDEVAGAGSGWTVGSIVYVATGGGLTQTRPSGGDYVIMAGIAASATDLFVLPQYMGKAP